MGSVRAQHSSCSADQPAKTLAGTTPFPSNQVQARPCRDSGAKSGEQNPSSTVNPFTFIVGNEAWCRLVTTVLDRWLSSNCSKGWRTTKGRSAWTMPITTQHHERSECVFLRHAMSVEREKNDATASIHDVGRARTRIEVVALIHNQRSVVCRHVTSAPLNHS